MKPEARRVVAWLVLPTAGAAASATLSVFDFWPLPVAVLTGAAAGIVFMWLGTRRAQ